MKNLVNKGNYNHSDSNFQKFKPKKKGKNLKQTKKG
jgi:hypothetical protein